MIKTGISRKSPSLLFFFSHTKVGKTSLISGLPNSLLVDFENGSEFVNTAKCNIKKEASEQNKPPLKIVRELVDVIQAANAEKKDYVYDYIVLDTATGMEDLAVTLATMRYKNSNLNAKGEYTGNNIVMDLPKGAGYLWLRNAFEELYNNFNGLAGKALIITGHVKLTSFNRAGQEMGARDIDLTGKLKIMIAQAADAIGYMYRSDEDPNVNILSFVTSSDDLATGARPFHLSGKEFEISRRDPKTGEITCYWDKIFID